MTDGLYFGAASQGRRIFCARAIVTAPVIFSTAAGTGGPLLWNGTTDKVARILAVGCAVTVASTVAGGLGLTGAGGQVLAPTTATAIDTSACLYIGGPTPSCTAYRLGTVTNAGTFFLPFGQITTGALTVGRDSLTFLPINGLVTVPPGTWCSIAGSATLTTVVAQLSLVWEEIPL